MKAVDLEEILEKNDVTMYSRFHDYETHYNNILNAMKEACEQTLQLAAENADLTVEYTDSEIMSQEHNVTIFDELGDLKQVIYANKQSILYTINQIK